MNEHSLVPQSRFADRAAHGQWNSAPRSRRTPGTKPL